MAATRILVTLLFLSSTVSAYQPSSQEIQQLESAIESYDAGRLMQAEQATLRVIQASPGFDRAYLVLAYIVLAQGKTQKAEDLLKEASRVNPKLQQELADERRETARFKEQTFRRQDFSRFTVFYERLEDRTQAWTAVEKLNAAWNELTSHVGLTPTDKIAVVVFSPLRMWTTWMMPGWVGGFFDELDGKVRISFMPEMGEVEFTNRLRHEFAHAFLHHLTPQKIPRWFDEGFAQYVALGQSRELFRRELRLKELSKLMAGEWLSAESLQKTLEYRGGSLLTLQQAYWQGEAVVICITTQRGDGTLAKIIQGMHLGQPFDQAFEKAMGQKVAAFVGQCRREMR